MYCSKCGSQNPPTAAYCIRCSALLAPAQAVANVSIEQDPAMRMLLPIGRSWWAMAAGYLGLVSILILPAPFALLCGIMGIIDIKKNPDRHGMGRCLLGVITGSLFTGLLLLMVISIVLAPE